MDLVVAGTAEDRVAAIGTRLEGLSRGGRGAAVVVAGDDVVTRAAVDDVVAGTARIDVLVVRRRTRPVGRGGGAVHLVPGTCVDRVVAGTAGDHVAAGVAFQHVVARFAGDDVVAQAADDVVVAADRAAAAFDGGVEVDVGDVDAGVIADAQRLHLGVHDLDPRDRARDVDQRRPGRIGLEPVGTVGDQRLVAGDAVVVLHMNAGAGLDVDRHAVAVHVVGIDLHHGGVVDVVDAEADRLHIFREVQVVGDLLAVLVEQRVHGTVGIGRGAVRRDGMDLLGLRLEGRDRVFVRAGDREGHVHVARVLGEAGIQVVAIVDGRAVHVRIGGLRPFEAFAHELDRRRTGAAVAVVTVKTVVAAATVDLVIARAAKDVVSPVGLRAHGRVQRAAGAGIGHGHGRRIGAGDLVVGDARVIRDLAQEGIGLARVERLVGDEADDVVAVEFDRVDVDDDACGGLDGIGVFGREAFAARLGVAVKGRRARQLLVEVAVVEAIVVVVHAHGGRCRAGLDGEGAADDVMLARRRIREGIVVPADVVDVDVAQFPDGKGVLARGHADRHGLRRRRCAARRADGAGGIAVDDVVTRAAEQLVRTAVALDVIVAFLAAHEIVAVAAEQLVVVKPAPDDVVTRAAEEGILAGALIGPERIVDEVVPGTAVGDIRACTAQDGVMAGAAEQGIVAGATVDQVVAFLAVDIVIVGSAIELVVADTTPDLVVAAVAEEGIAAFALVGTGRIVDHVVARPTIDEVVAGKGLDVVVAAKAVNDVVLRTGTRQNRIVVVDAVAVGVTGVVQIDHVVARGAFDDPVKLGAFGRRAVVPIAPPVTLQQGVALRQVRRITGMPIPVLVTPLVRTEQRQRHIQNSAFTTPRRLSMHSVGAGRQPRFHDHRWTQVHRTKSSAWEEPVAADTKIRLTRLSAGPVAPIDRFCPPVGQPHQYPFRPLQKRRKWQHKRQKSVAFRENVQHS